MRQIQCKRCGAIISVSGEKYLCDSCAKKAKQESVVRFQDGTVQDDIAVRRITGGINQLVRGKTTTYKGWKIAKKEGNDND